ncbi:Methyltransferase domain-containing protein [Actinopolymorpha cephalotaxi]|uniref:Methyltransferase domain-containing protein n=1 Tax=Actinopolymorpha cephalotaxi TaxID=504797 RepID=A0A1I2UAR3_9ACTN|nr:class I SAM-dependent methyltransferase [Actinopolymorpha cephalotaxi]NYH86512.1 SAM-dependent methyltransferase [Actinopolymorpha cephalotaxi]SFG74234.1 Methyltransferase domain-containing protein [Actinopolymorpha cephalotaxi]
MAGQDPEPGPETDPETDPKQIVRRGYDAISYAYRGDGDDGDDGDDPRYARWIDELTARVPAGGAVLDLGCGCGVPVARALHEAGYAVTGVDLSDVQIARARALVPGATFLRADATAVEFPAGSFDAVVCLYALIHVPLDEQPALLARIASWLRPGGRLLATAGHTAWTGSEENWLGAPMWWSHADAATYRGWLTRAGLTITGEEFVPEGDSGHSLFRARRS